MINLSSNDKLVNNGKPVCQLDNTVIYLIASQRIKIASTHEKNRKYAISYLRKKYNVPSDTCDITCVLAKVSILAICILAKKIVTSMKKGVKSQVCHPYIASMPSVNHKYAIKNRKYVIKNRKYAISYLRYFSQLSQVCHP